MILVVGSNKLLELELLYTYMMNAYNYMHCFPKKMEVIKVNKAIT